MFPWDDYEIFAEVVRHGGFTAAAKHLGISKSVVSRHVATLEERLGTQLLLRTTRHVCPTEAGRDLYSQCATALKMLSVMEHKVLDGHGVPRGLFKIAALDFFGEAFVAPVAARMMDTYEGLEIELHISSEPRNIVADAFDVALLYDEQKSSTYLSRKVFNLDHCVAASPQYLKVHGVPRHPDDLLNHRCLVSTFAACASWSFVIGGRRVDYDLTGRWKSNSAAALISAARTGVGLTRIPRLYLEHHLETEELVTVLDEFPSAPMPVWAVYAHSRQPSVTLRVFLDELVRSLRSISREQRAGRSHLIRSYSGHNRIAG